jgi:hypothetical protein
MISLSASADFGLTGQYVARITGRDAKFTFAREFVGAKYGKRNEGTSADVDDPGLYECRDVTRKGRVDRFWLVVEVDGQLVKLRSDKEDAMAIARALDDRRPFVEIVEASQNAGSDPPVYMYEIVSPKAAKAAQQAQTVDRAIEACWAAMQALPEKEAKKVLRALAARVSPPKPAVPPVASPEPEAAHFAAGACAACGGGACLIYRSPEASS